MHTHQVGFNFNLYKMHGEYNIKYKVFYSFTEILQTQMLLKFIAETRVLFEHF